MQILENLICSSWVHKVTILQISPKNLPITFKVIMLKIKKAFTGQRQPPTTSGSGDNS